MSNPDPNEGVIILIAEDDPDDRMLAIDAAREGQLASQVEFVEDGERLLEYLHSIGAKPGSDKPMPRLILLDLNMPKMDGREALRAIKSDPALRRIPVIVFTTSSAEEDIATSYDLGVNSFIIKPASFERLVDVMRSIKSYWIDTVALPKINRGF